MTKDVGQKNSWFSIGRVVSFVVAIPIGIVANLLTNFLSDKDAELTVQHDGVSFAGHWHYGITLTNIRRQ